MIGCDLPEPGQLTANKLTANQQFHHSDLVTDFATVISSQSEGLGKMALGVVQDTYDRSSQLIGVIWFAVSLLRSVVVDLINQPVYKLAQLFSSFNY